MSQSDWELAETRRDKGHRLLRQLTGPRAENLEQAIAHLTFAVEVYERHNACEEWAATLNDLAQAYQERVLGDPSSNQEQAIQLYGMAHEVYKRDSHPQAWAIIQHNLGNTYLGRIAGRREENQRQAERCYQDALTVFSQDNTPYQWARVCNGLGLTYLGAVTGDRAENLESALDCFQKAARVFALQGYGADYADAQSHLGTAWRHRIRGSHAENLERSINCYKEALRVLDPVEQLDLWGDVHHNLSISYTERVRGKKVDNLHKAQEHLAHALEAPKAARPAAKTTQTHLQQIRLWMTGQVGPQADRIEQAIAELERLAGAETRQARPFVWAQIALGLGNAYIMRVRGDRVRNIEAAIDHFEQALQVITVHNAPVEWSIIQNGLSAACVARPIGDRRKNLTQAIDGLRSDLDDLLAQGRWVEWARMNHNLAGAFWHRGRYYRDVVFDDARADADFRRAIGHAQRAQRWYARHGYAFETALSNYALGNALSDLTTKKAQGKRWSKAVEYYLAALDVFTDQAYALQRAWALNDYGVTLLNLAHARGPSNLPDIRNAIQLFKKAIETHRDSGLRTEILRSTINLGALYHALGNWRAAHQELSRAVEIIETLRADALGEPGHVHIAEGYTRAYQYLVDACVHLQEGYWQEALERVEASKGRAFLAQLGSDDYPVPAGLPSTSRDEDAALSRAWREAETELRNLEGTPLEEREKRQLRSRLLQQQEQLMTRQNVLLGKIESQAPDYVALRRGKPARYADLQSLLDRTDRQIGVVELFPVQERLLAFVLRTGLNGPIVISVDLDQETLRSAHVEPFEPVLRGRRTRSWMGDLGERLFSEIGPHLHDVDLVYLIPTGSLHALPLHALPVGGQCLIERYPVAYAPSLTILSRVITRARQRSAADEKRTLVVGNPANPLPPLEAAEALAREVAQRFDVHPLVGDQATKQEVLKRLPAADKIYFACHGAFDPQVPMHSGLYMARTDGDDELKDILTVREIMETRLSADLVVLSACQSGLNQVRRGDELIGLARAFLYAGASTVIVALWSVSEESAAQLMQGFFERLYSKGRKVTETATALQTASLELLSDGYLDFFDWAPFIVVGDWR